MIENEFSRAFSGAFDAGSGSIPGGCISVDWSCVEPEKFATYDDATIARAEQLAAAAIRVLTGGQVGNCPTVVRPCTSACAASGSMLTGAPWMTPYISNGVWYNTCGCRPGTCSCTALVTVRLPGPIGLIESVKVDGETVDPSFYFVDDARTLTRIGGPEWPRCQDMTAPDTAEGTMSVTYVRGAVLDSLGEFVAGLLAREFLNACTDAECSLPASVISLARQGVTMEFGDGVFPGNRTGIDAVDIWVSSWNPYGVRTPSRVYSVDRPRPVIPTGGVL